MKKKHIKYILLTLVVIDLLLLALSFLFPTMSFFNIDMESNLPTIYQGLKLILIGSSSLLILLLLPIASIKLERFFWLFWFFMFFFLGVDELTQLHENIQTYVRELTGQGSIIYEEVFTDLGYSSTPWLLYYMFFFILSTFFIVFAARKLKDLDKSSKLFLAIGWVLCLSVLLVEYINTKEGIMFGPSYLILVSIEELLEMVGASFLFVFTVSRVTDLLNSLKSKLLDS